MEDALKSLALFLEPSESWVSQAKSKVKELFSILETNAKPPLARWVLVGGLAKRTSTRLKVDIDAVGFYNDEKKRISRNDVLADWMQILIEKTDLKVRDFRCTPFLLSFVYKDVNFDIVAVRDNIVDGRYPEREQMRNDLNEVLDSYHALEASKDLTLSAQSVEWMRVKRPIAIEVARLAKFWSQTILFDEVVFGKSYIFESLAVKAVTDESAARPGSPTYLGAFCRFLELVERISKLRVTFEHGNCDWYCDSEIPPEVSSERPLLMDPVNPFRNLLNIGDVQNLFFEVFSAAASETLLRIGEARREIDAAAARVRRDVTVDRSSGGDYETGRQRDLASLEEEVLTKVLRPQSSMEDRKHFPLKLSDVVVLDSSSPPAFPKRLVENLPAVRHERRHVENFLDSLLLNLAAVATMRQWRGGDVPVSAIGAVESFLEESPWSAKPSSATSKGEKELDFQIPVSENQMVVVEANLLKLYHESEDFLQKLKGKQAMIDKQVETLNLTKYVA